MVWQREANPQKNEYLRTSLNFLFAAKERPKTFEEILFPHGWNWSRRNLQRPKAALWQATSLKALSAERNALKAENRRPSLWFPPATKECPKTFEEILFPHGWDWSQHSKDIQRILKTCTSEGEKEKPNVISFPSFTLPMDRTLCEISSVQKPLCDRQLHSKRSQLKETHWRLKIVDLPYGFPPPQRNAQKLSRKSSFHMAEIGHSTPRISKEFWRLAQARARKKSPTW